MLYTESLAKSLEPNLASTTKCFIIPRTHDFTLPEDFFEIHESNIKKDIFLSNDYYQFPHYYVDIERILVPRKDLPLIGNVLEIVEGSIIDYMSKLLTTLTSLDEAQGFYLPVFYYNYYLSDFQHFGFFFVTRALTSRNRVLFYYYPLQFFVMHYMTLRGNNEGLMRVLSELPEYALDQHVRLFKLRGFSKQNIISSRLQHERISEKNANELINKQNKLINSWYALKRDVLTRFNEVQVVSYKTHEKGLCLVCNEDLDTDRKKFTLKSIQLAVYNKLKPPVINKIRDRVREKLFDFKQYFEIIPRKYYKEFVPFGNPFKYAIKLKPEKATDYSIEDDMTVYEPRKQKKNHKAEYNAMKRAIIKNYIGYTSKNTYNDRLEQLNSDFDAIYNLKIDRNDRVIDKIDIIKKIDHNDKSQSIKSNLNTTIPFKELDDLTVFEYDLVKVYNPIDVCFQEFDKLENILLERSQFKKSAEFVELHFASLKLVSENPKVNAIIQLMQS